MANVIRIKRRGSGNAGAPAALKSAELAHNEVDNTLYIGKGDDGAGNATSVVPLAGNGAFADLSSPQTIAGAKTFSTVPRSSEDASSGSELVRKSQFDTALSGKASTSHAHAIPEVTGLEAALAGKAAASHGHSIAEVTGLQTVLDGKAASSHGHAIPDVAGLQTTLDAKLDGSQVTAFGLSLLDDADAAAGRSTLGLGTAALQNSSAFAAATHAHAISDVTGLQPVLDGKAPLVSPVLTGTPSAPTASGGTNNTQIATTAFVQAAITAVVNGAPGALDTLSELAAALGNDASFATTITNALASKLTASSNLVDLTNVPAARSNLGLGSIVTQDANSVAITGGTIDGVTMEGGTF